MNLKIFLVTAILTLPLFINAQHLTVTKSIPFFDVDISGSSGNYNGKTYSEVHLGLNLNFAEWLTWRNAVFRRFSSVTGQDLTGLDSSLRFILNTQVENAGLKFFAGPGYRWADRSDKNALFGEAGAGIQIGRFGAGAGLRYMKYDKVQLDSAGGETKQEDLNYFITVAGGTGLSF